MSVFMVPLLIIYVFTIAWNIVVSIFIEEYNRLHVYYREYLGLCMGISSEVYCPNCR